MAQSEFPPNRPDPRYSPWRATANTTARKSCSPIFAAKDSLPDTNSAVALGLPHGAR